MSTRNIINKILLSLKPLIPQDAGVWEKLHLAMLKRLREHNQINWRRASIDGASVASPRGAKRQAQPQLIVENWAANGQANCMPTKAMSMLDAVVICASAASKHASPEKASKAKTACDGIAGSSSEDILGLLALECNESVLNADSTFTKHCSRSRLQSSLHASRMTRVSGSKWLYALSLIYAA